MGISVMQSISMVIHGGDGDRKYSVPLTRSVKTSYWPFSALGVSNLSVRLVPGAEVNLRILNGS